MLLLRTLVRSSVLRQQPPVCDDPGLNVLVQGGSVDRWSRAEQFGVIEVLLLEADECESCHCPTHLEQLRGELEHAR